MVLLVAGYDTTGSALAYCCYDLSKNPEVQDKLRSEVEEVCDTDDDQEITYDQLQSMTYLDQVLKSPKRPKLTTNQMLTSMVHLLNSTSLTLILQ